MEKKWYVFYTRSRWEKKVQKLLERNGFQVFLPLHKVMRQWSDRKKKVEVPLFNSYLFVKSTKDDIYEILKIPGIVKNIKFNGEPTVLRNKEYEQINRWIELGIPIEVSGSNEDLTLGEKVKIAEGEFKGIEGEIYRINETTCAVLIESIQQMLKIQIRKELLLAL